MTKDDIATLVKEAPRSAAAGQRDTRGRVALARQRH